MRKLLSVASILVLSLPALCQKMVIAVIGSSTSAGFGASIPDSAYINLTKAYYKGLGLIDTIYNFGDASTTTYNGMPTGFVAPSMRPGLNPNENITMAMSKNPDIVIIHYPSNDIGDDFTLTEYLSNLRTMAGVVTAAGKIAYVATTQPRDAFNLAEKMNLQIGRDSILMEFAGFALDFYDPLIDPAPPHLEFNPLLTAAPADGGGVHPNDAGHQLLFQVVKNTLVFPGSTLPLTLFGFRASPEGNKIRLRWTSMNQQDPTSFEVQRSSNGTAFTAIATEKGKANNQGADYSWLDAAPLNGLNFYRLRIIAPAQETFSPVVSVVMGGKTPAGLIGRIVPVGSSLLNVEINVPDNQKTDLRVYTAGGILIGRQSFGSLSPGTVVAVPVNRLSTGLYFITVTTADGHKESKAFNKF